jgi:formate-dependent nitrite reductase cytochrome c552 subunit
MPVKNEFTKANVKRSTKRIINKIAADEDKYEYELIEELFREKYPNYFQSRKTISA